MSNLHRYEIHTHGGGSASIGAEDEVTALLNLIAAQVETVQRRDEERRESRQRPVSASAMIANLPARIEHAAMCRCQRAAAMKAEELYA